MNVHALLSFEGADYPFQGAAKYPPESGTLIAGENGLIRQTTEKLIFSVKHFISPAM
jgi:hypothetical protein